MTAKKIQAYTLLKLLQIIYIWRDERQFHWFQALTYNSPWYDEKMWNTHPTSWENNLWAVCAWDNDTLAVSMQQGILPQDELSNFNEKLLVLCAEYDAISVFKSTQMELFQPERHLGLMATNCSIKLLHFYQSSKNIKHLDLDRFGLPKKLPANINDFTYLMSQGYSYLPMGQLIERFCKEGRLDLLVYLYELEPKLIPYKEDLMLAAENGWLDILQWGSKLIQKWQVSKSLAVKLAVNDHLKALDWLVNESNMTIDDEMIKEIIVAGQLNALQWIYKRQPFRYKTGWVALGVENRHLPILEWLCETFAYIPSAYNLRNSTAEILDWRRATSVDFIYKDLVKYGAGNLETLQWAHKNAPISIFNDYKLAISLSIKDRNTMQWLYSELKICPSEMMWAYEAGDLAAIQWALKTCQVIPRVENIACAIVNGRLNIIKWIHKNYPKYLRIDRALHLIKSWGSLEMIDYIASNFELRKAQSFYLDDNTDWDQRLNIIKWIRKHGYYFSGSLTKEVDKFVANGQLQPFLNFCKTFPGVEPSWWVWHSAAKFGHHEIYKWHLENCSLMYQLFELEKDIQVAFVNGHLEIVKMILRKYPTRYEDISNLDITRSNYHIKRWLDVNFKSAKSSGPNWILVGY